MAFNTQSKIQNQSISKLLSVKQELPHRSWVKLCADASVLINNNSAVVGVVLQIVMEIGFRALWVISLLDNAQLVAIKLGLWMLGKGGTLK